MLLKVRKKDKIQRKTTHHNVHSKVTVNREMEHNKIEVQLAEKIKINVHANWPF